MVRKWKATIGALAVLGMVAAAVPPAMADATTPAFAPATVGAPNNGYTTPVQVEVSQVACSGGTAGAWVSVPAQFTAAVDVAAGVWQTPAGWVIGGGGNVAAPGSGATACYQVDAVTLNGVQYGTPGAGDVAADLYPSGAWQPAKEATAPTAGVMSPNKAAIDKGTGTVVGSVYAVQATGGADSGGGGYTVATPPPSVLGGSAVTTNNGGKYGLVPIDSCVTPNVLVLVQIDQLTGVWECVIPNTPGQNAQQTVQQATSGPPPYVGWSPENQTGTCTGGTRNGQVIPPSAYNQTDAQTIEAWCTGH